MATATAPRAGLAQQQELVLPPHRRLVANYGADAAGLPELRLQQGELEISFDDPAFFAFGETLARQSRFTAGAAATWGRGYAWQQVQPLLEQLLDAGVLVRNEGAARIDTHDQVGARPSPLPPATRRTPPNWADADSCRQLMLELTGRPLDPGWLELVLPVFRVAHAALDADGRQVGEANVFPRPLRMDVPTAWRSCIYAGTRYQSERPMNVTALKSMRLHWDSVLQALSQVRASYLRRFPDAQAGWTVGHLERLASCVLAVPTYQLMRQPGGVGLGRLHPALSSMFRVSDGLRMVMHQMLFVPGSEPTLNPDAAMDSARILAWAERNQSFHSETGVCAGPHAMIEQFLAVLVDGAPAPQQPLHADVQQALDDVEAALDYGLLGLQAHAAVFTLWPMMARSYERLAGIAQDWAAHGAQPVRDWSLRLQGHLQRLRAAFFLADETLRVRREAVYADMYARCAEGLGEDLGGLHLHGTLPGQLQPMLSCTHAQADRQLEELLQQRLGRADQSDRADARRLRDAVMEFLLQAQAVVQVATRVQARINALLGRAEPQQPFGAADIEQHNRLRGADPQRLPFLIDELQLLLQARITVTADALRIEPHTPASDVQAPACHPHDSPGIPPFETRASSAQTTKEKP